MNKYGKLIIFISILSIAMAGYWLRYPKVEEHIHYHSGFIVYIDDVRQDYSDYKYMNFVPCSEHESKMTLKEEQIEKAHLHDGVSDVVHIHRIGSKWVDLFTNINIQLPTDKQLTGYIDGKEVVDIMSQPIAAYSTAIFVIGKNEIDHSKEIISVDHIKEVEAKSELCSTD